MNEEHIPIDCISITDAGGNITPLRFRLERKDRQWLRVHIDQVLDTRHIPYVGVEAQIFFCRGTAEGRNQIFELRYAIRSHSWFLVQRSY